MRKSARKSVIATRFRIWATQRLREFLVKRLTINDDRLKEPANDRYFEELLARIRDIRSSEKVFWRKVLAIYATSIDYDPQAVTTQELFKRIQNQMHWAAHGHTAAELIMQRADAKLPLISAKSHRNHVIKCRWATYMSAKMAHCDCQHPNTLTAAEVRPNRQKPKWQAISSTLCGVISCPSSPGLPYRMSPSTYKWPRTPSTVG